MMYIVSNETYSITKYHAGKVKKSLRIIAEGRKIVSRNAFSKKGAEDPVFHNIRQIKPVAPSLTILLSVPRNLSRTSSGNCTTLVFSPSRIIS